MNLNADVQLIRLLQLASPALPVGAYSYSQGLESAVEAGMIRDAESTRAWLADLLELSVGRTEAPMLLRLIDRWQERDWVRVDYWNRLFLASRESAELRAETMQMGYSLAKLLIELEASDEKALAHLAQLEEISFPAAFAFGAAGWNIPAAQALVAYLWAWLENQVMAAIKLVPLGQTVGQRILLALGQRLAAAAQRAAELADDDLGGSAPALAILSSRHETQYSRLFRS